MSGASLPTTEGRPAYPSTPGVQSPRRAIKSSTSARVPGRVVCQGRGRMTARHTAALIATSVALRPRVGARCCGDAGGRERARIAHPPPFGKCGSADCRWRYAIGLPGALSATFHRGAPARLGAFGDERRVAMGDDGGGPTKADAKRSSSPSGGAAPATATRVERLRAQTNACVPPKRSSPPSVATCPRIAARSAMSGESSPATKAAACGRETLIQSPRALGVRFCRSSSRQRVEFPAVRSGS
jgi:hypothetical protein